MTQIDLSEYEKNPSDPNILVEFAQRALSDGKHDSTVMFAEAALAIAEPQSDARIKALEKISIAGFYSKMPARKEAGRLACEDLGIDRRVPWSTRYAAGQNGTWYSLSATQLMPGTRLQEVAFTPPDDYKPMNPSIIRWRDQLWMIQRTVNYIITPSGHYDMRGDTAIRTRNWLLKLNDDLSVASAHEIFPPKDLPAPLYDLVIGFEDSRLFIWNDQMWATSTVRELNQPGNCEIVLARIDQDENGQYHYADYRAIHPQGLELQHQKNWMPLVIGKDLRFIYSSDPVRIIDDQGKTVTLNSTDIAADSFRGGGQALPFDDGWLAVVHGSFGMPDGRRRYMHRFVKYDNELKLVAYTHSFHIAKLGIEFAAGLATNPTTGDIIVSFGLEDRESWLASIPAEDVRNALIGVTQPTFAITADDEKWILSQTNTALQDTASVVRATRIQSGLGLRHHEDAVKNWDNIQSLLHTIKTTPKAMPVMDVAATTGSAYLPSLARYGFENLISINLTQTEREVIDGVTYQYGDCTKTDFPDKTFGFVSCLSVIEHGVDVASFMQESARILAPGGYLFVSTDYWQDPVDTKGQMAFGVPVRVFDRNGIREMISTARSFGLELTSEPKLDCNERTVNWIGMDYTFVALLFRKKD